MSVLILGATSPIAAAVAREYASKGHPVFLAARNTEAAGALADELAKAHGVETGFGAFDALETDTHAALVARVEEELGPLEVALVAFGDMGDHDAAQHDPAAARRIIDVNYTGAVSICEAAAAALTAHGAGSIIGISSVAGERGRQSNYIYGSAKGALSLYLQGLRNRLHPLGVHVMTAKLGFVATRMTEGLETAIPIADPADVGRALYSAERRGKNVVYYPKFWAGIMGVIRAIPESVFKRMKL